jgi:hypothetical protein
VKRPEELSTKMTLERDGTEDDSSLLFERLGTKDVNRGIFERGAFLGRLVSVEMMRCAAVRCDIADSTCVLLNAGLRGTYSFCQLKIEILHKGLLGLTRTAPSLNNAYVTWLLISVFSQQQRKNNTHRSKLSIVAQHNSTSIPSLHTPLHQPPSQSIAIPIELLIR